LVTSKACSRSAGPFPLPLQAANVRIGTDGRRLLAYVRNIVGNGYEFESGKPAIS
jgi:hypothetical protein